MYGLRDSLPKYLQGCIVIKVSKAKTDELVTACKEQTPYSRLSGIVESVDTWKKTCSVRSDFFTMDDVPLHYVLGRYNPDIREKHYGKECVEPLFGDQALAQQYMHDVEYAEQLLHSIRNNRNWSAATGTLRLLHHISRIIQNRIVDERKGKDGGIDRKLKRRIDEKKQAHGLRQG